MRPLTHRYRYRYACSGMRANMIIAGLESAILVSRGMNDGSSLRAIVDAAAELAQHEQRGVNAY
jgi:20S proteasome alpha/beta subunit